MIGIEPSNGFIVSHDPDDCLVIVANVAPPPAVPGIPSDVTATAGRAKVDLTWVTPSAPGDAPITGYRIRYRTTGAPSWSVVETTGSGTSRTISALLNTVEYGVQIAALNSSGASDYSTLVAFLPGLVNGTVVSDAFGRTVTDVVGTTPSPTGLNPYSEATAQFEVDGSRLIGKSTAAGSLVLLDTGARGDTTLDVTLRTATLANAAATSMRIYPKYVDTNNYMYIGIGIAASGTPSAPTAFLNVAGSGGALAIGFPAGALPSTTAEADYAVHISIIGTALSVTINGVTRGVTLTSPQAAALAPSTKIGLTDAAGNNTNVKYDNLTVAVNGTYV